VFAAAVGTVADLPSGFVPEQVYGGQHYFIITGSKACGGGLVLGKRGQVRGTFDYISVVLLQQTIRMR
jgi:hypothetical protein